MKVVLIAPTINEAEGLRQVFPRLNKKILDEIIVVDLNSTDGTLEYCKENGYHVHNQQSRGYGADYMEVIRNNNADIIILAKTTEISNNNRIKIEFASKFRT